MSLIKYLCCVIDEIFMHFTEGNKELLMLSSGVYENCFDLCIYSSQNLVVLR